MPVKTVKFGGSSLADENQFKKVAAICKSDPSRRYIVPSAPGKRFKDDVKVTDMLYGCYDAVDSDEFESRFAAVKARFDGIISALGLDMSLEHEYEKIKTSLLLLSGRDYAASRGEYLNGMILAKYLGVPFIDAAKVIFFKEDGRFDAEKTNAVLSAKLKKYPTAVIPGFYGSMPNDTIKTFSRGGSDITGAIVARASQSDLYENWTDVSGFFAADPRIVENPKLISVITYRELRELSYMGASVLHEDSVFPVRIASIPINIRNTNSPEDAGTLIVDEIESSRGATVTGIAGRKGFCSITVEKDMMNSALGFGRKILGVLEQNGVSFEHIPSGIDSVSVVVAEASIAGKEEKIENELKELIDPDRFEIERDLALISVVGRGMIRKKGISARLFTGLADAGINVRMIDQGSGELNIIVGVAEKDFENAVRAIYSAFDKCGFFDVK